MQIKRNINNMASMQAWLERPLLGSLNADPHWLKKLSQSMFIFAAVKSKGLITIVVNRNERPSSYLDNRAGFVLTVEG